MDLFWAWAMGADRAAAMAARAMRCLRMESLLGSTGGG
jgi:hypothetical protein